MSDWSTAFSALVLAVQPGSDPILSKGGGAEPDAERELDQILLASARGTVWVASTPYTYGQYVFPVTKNGHYFKVITAGTSGSTEPTWTVETEGQVSSGTVVFEEAGIDGGIYDVRGAIRGAWLVKASKASEYLADEKEIYQRCVEQAQRYQSIGVA
jgi:hypothetical protein